MYQAILNAMPPHRTYIEAFVGSGQILLRKKPAASTIVIDADAAVAAHWSTIAARGGAVLTVMRGDARSLIPELGAALDRSTLIYCDPPYVMGARRSQAPIYRHEFDDDDHEQLLALLLRLPCMVMLSGYRSPLYDRALYTWRRIDYRATTHAGPVIESLWCNFPEPVQLHEYSHLGANFRERERIKRKKTRWHRRLAEMPELERRAILDVLLELAPPPLAIGTASSAAGRDDAGRDPHAIGGEGAGRSRTAGAGEWCRPVSPQPAMLAN